MSEELSETALSGGENTEFAQIAEHYKAGAELTLSLIHI